jgi:anti-sigma B factor antagonist
MDEPVRITDEGDGTLEVSLFGDIDFANSPSVRETIRAAVSEAAPTAVRVDLAAVTFLDSSGIAVLVIAHRLAGSLGADYRVVNPTPSVYEHLRLTGLANLFRVPRPEAVRSTEVPGAGTPGVDTAGTGTPGADRPGPPVAR